MEVENGRLYMSCPMLVFKLQCLIKQNKFDLRNLLIVLTNYKRHCNY